MEREPDWDGLVRRLEALLQNQGNVAEDLADALIEREDFSDEQRNEARMLASNIRHAEALLEGWARARGIHGRA